jgi:hypothetical protein
MIYKKTKKSKKTKKTKRSKKTNKNKKNKKSKRTKKYGGTNIKNIEDEIESIQFFIKEAEEAKKYGEVIKLKKSLEELEALKEALKESLKESSSSSSSSSSLQPITEDQQYFHINKAEQKNNITNSNQKLQTQKSLTFAEFSLDNTKGICYANVVFYLILYLKPFITFVKDIIEKNNITITNDTAIKENDIKNILIDKNIDNMFKNDKYIKFLTFVSNLYIKHINEQSNKLVTDNEQICILDSIIKLLPDRECEFRNSKNKFYGGHPTKLLECTKIILFLNKYWDHNYLITRVYIYSIDRFMHNNENIDKDNVMKIIDDDIQEQINTFDAKDVNLYNMFFMPNIGFTCSIKTIPIQKYFTSKSGVKHELKMGIYLTTYDDNTTHVIFYYFTTPKEGDSKYVVYKLDSYVKKLELYPIEDDRITIDIEKNKCTLPMILVYGNKNYSTGLV